jgi:hypothetical protein
LVDNGATANISYGLPGDRCLRLRTKAAAYGISGLILASAVIFSGAAAGLLDTRSSGLLSVMLTDPPSVPYGVTAVYISYSGIAVHAEGFGDGSWVAVSGAGTVDTTRLTNLSQTISSADVPSLTYDVIRLNITGASVEFMGKNYSAHVSSGTVTVPFVGGLKVNSSTPAAALIDIQPTVLNLGTQFGPDFNMAAGARALQVPSWDVGGSLRNVGSTFDLMGDSWFNSFRSHHPDALNSTQPTLTADSLSFSETNGGDDSLVVRMVMVTPTIHGGGDFGPLDSVADGIVFSVGSDGTLTPLSGSPNQVGSLFGDRGYTLAPGATFRFTYSGTLTSLLGGSGITEGTSYYVTVIGSETLSVQTVVAS